MNGKAELFGSMARAALGAGALLSIVIATGARAREAEPQAKGKEPRVEARVADESRFPEIAVDVLITRPDGAPVLDATREEIKVFESGREMPVIDFRSPLSITLKPTTIVLVVDRSGSMRERGKMPALKAAVRTFLKGLPRGSRVAVVAFSDDVELICKFTDDLERVEASVEEIFPLGSTCYFDAVAAAIELIAKEQGRRAVLALTDGIDTSSRENNVESVIATARRSGLAVNTLGLGREDELAEGPLAAIAEGTGGKYYPARDADQLKSIYEEIARSLKNSYSLVYRTDRKLPDGTLRPISVRYGKSSSAGETAVFIRGMVVPAAGWPRLFVLLLAGVVGLFAAPRFLKSRMRTIGEPQAPSAASLGR